MRIMWLVSMVLPKLAMRLKLPVVNSGGWMPSLVDGVRKFAPDIELMVVSEGPSYCDEEIDGVRYVALGPARLRARQKWISAEFEAKLEKLVFQYKPSVIHIHGTESLWNGLSEGFLSRHRAHIVASLQGIITGYAPHYAGNLTSSEVWNARNIPNILLTRYTIQRAASYWRNRLAKKEGRFFSSVVNFLGRTDWDRAWTKYLNPDASYYHVGEIMRSLFYSGKRDGGKVVRHSIYCGAAFGYSLKGGHWLLRAIAALKRQYPDVQLRVANSRKSAKPKCIRDWLRQSEYNRYLSGLIDELGIEGNVVLLPALSEAEVHEELGKAEVLCIPSACENSPNSIGEAMLTGCPVVATNVGGVSSIIEDGVTGLLVPSADPAMLADRIAYLFGNRDAALRLSETAYKVAVARYRPRDVVADLRSAYDKVQGGAS